MQFVRVAIVYSNQFTRDIGALSMHSSYQQINLPNNQNEEYACHIHVLLHQTVPMFMFVALESPGMTITLNGSLVIFAAQFGF